jgi:hypothetical protein
VTKGQSKQVFNSPSSAWPLMLSDLRCASMSYTMIFPLPAPAMTSLPSAENRMLQIYHRR